MNSQRGFTLIEIMVVVVIAAILMGAVTISFPRTDEDLLKEDGDRFSAIIALIQDEAILQSRDMAMSVIDGGYEFYSREDSAWSVYSEAPFVPRKLKGNNHAELYVEGDSIKLKSASKTKPQIVIYSSGEMTPFTYVITNPKKSTVTIDVNAVGVIKKVLKVGDE